jgi:hypothetical protein
MFKRLEAGRTCAERRWNARSRAVQLAICVAVLPVLGGCEGPTAEGEVGSQSEALRNGKDGLREFIARQSGGLE